MVLLMLIKGAHIDDPREESGKSCAAISMIIRFTRKSSDKRTSHFHEIEAAMLRGEIVEQYQMMAR